jgi:hypothetical protein
MPVLVLFQWKGDPDELLTAYDRELQHPVAKQQRRRISHTCARADDGMVIVDLWESADDLQAMMEDPDFQRNLSDSGTPEPASPQIYEIHQMIS